MSLGLYSMFLKIHHLSYFVQFDFHSFAYMKDLPIFHNLTHLKLGLARMWLDMLPTFLQKFSRLEVLVVDKVCII